LDVTRLDLDALIDKALGMVSEHMGEDSAKLAHADLDDFRSQASAQLRDLLQAGGKDVLLLFSMYDFPYFSVVIPIPPGADKGRLNQEVQKIVKAFKLGGLTTQVSEPVIRVGRKQTVTRPQSASPERLKILNEALKGCADTLAQLVFCPSPDQRRVLMEMLPQIPLDLGPVQWTTLSQNLDWAALGLNGPPALSMDLTIQSVSAEGAGSILTSIKDIYADIGKKAEAHEEIPDLDASLRRLTPKQEGRHLRLQVDAQTLDSLIKDALAPSLARARDQARRVACMNNLRQIGLGLFMYADDHDDKLPSDLKVSTIGKYLGSNPRIFKCPATRSETPYVYRGATLTVGDTPWMITVYDKKGNHQDGRNVAFLDGHAQWVTEERFRKLVEKDNEYRRAKQLPVLPIE